MNNEGNGWELFEKINKRAAEMAVRVYKGGQLSLTKAVHDCLGTDVVELMYNRERKLIGILPSVENSANHYNLRKPKRQNTWLLSAAAFISYYQLEDIKGKKFPASQEDSMIVIDLNNPLPK